MSVPSVLEEVESKKQNRVNHLTPSNSCEFPCGNAFVFEADGAARCGRM